MKNILLEESKFLQNENLKNAEAMAFDGEYFYICDSKQPVIYKLDIEGNEILQIDKKEKYGTICYDDHENCFWAAPSAPWPLPTTCP